MSNILKENKIKFANLCFKRTIKDLQEKLSQNNSDLQDLNQKHAVLLQNQDKL